MNFEDIKEQLQDQLKASLEKIKDSTLYIQLKERYDQLSPKNQKYLNIASAILVFYFIISIPISFLNEANTSIEKYKAQKELLARLVKTKEMKDNTPPMASPIEASRLSRNIESYLTKEGFKKEQITKTENFKEDNKGQFPDAPKDAIISGVKVALKQINLKQFVDVIYNTQRQARPGKMTHLKMSPNAEKAGFFDIEFEIRNFEVPVEETPKAEPRKRRRRK